MRRILIMSVATMLALAISAPVAVQGTDHPFQGVVHGYGHVEPDEACPPVDLRSVVSTTGYVNDLGMIELDWYNCTPAGADVEGIEMAFVTESGDSVFATYEAHDAPAVGEDPMMMEITYDFAITGGTGQFEGATGGGQLEATLGWPGYEPNYWPALVVIDGNIDY